MPGLRNSWGAWDFEVSFARKAVEHVTEIENGLDERPFSMHHYLLFADDAGVVLGKSLARFNLLLALGGVAYADVVIGGRCFRSGLVLS
jgi:hypothetical protein